MRHYSLAELKKLPTLCVSQDSDLKIEKIYLRNRVRVWLSRMTKEDGQPYDNMVMVEKFKDGAVSRFHRTGEPSARWEIVEEYQAV